MYVCMYILKNCLYLDTVLYIVTDFYQLRNIMLRIYGPHILYNVILLLDFKNFYVIVL
jgi:hypothetical protein